MSINEAIKAISNNPGGLAMHNRDWADDYNVYMNDEGKFVDSDENLWSPGYMDFEGVYKLVLLAPSCNIHNYPF